MSWTDDFVWELSRPAASPMFVLEFVDDYHSVLGGGGTVSSHGLATRIIGSQVVVGGGRLSVGSWSFTKGGWSVAVVDDGDRAHALAATLTRGTYAELRVGFPGWDEDAYEAVALGALVNVSGSAPELRFEFASLLTHWATKHETAQASLALFDDLDLDDADRSRVSTGVDADFALGGGTLTVADTTGFALGDTTGVLLAHDPTAGDPFFITYTGTTSTTFTTMGTTDLHSTVRTALTAADGVVYACAYLEGHPFDIARQILLSTGSGSNGARDVLPREWGFAAWPRWVDEDDIEEWKGIVGNKAGTDHDWSVIVEAAQTNAIGWLAQLLAEAGIWLVERQGKITLRACQNPDDTSALAYHAPLRSGITITDADIVEVADYQLWSRDVPAEAKSVVVWYNSGHSSGTTPDSIVITESSVSSLPAYTNADHDLLDVIWQASTHPATDIGYRAFTWEGRVPESVRLRCAGLRLAQLCPGDLVEVSSDRLRGRLDTTVDGWDEVTALVVGVNVRWMDGQVDLDLIAPSLEAGT